MTCAGRATCRVSVAGKPTLRQQQVKGNMSGGIPDVFEQSPGCADDASLLFSHRPVLGGNIIRLQMTTRICVHWTAETMENWTQMVHKTIGGNSSRTVTPRTPTTANNINRNTFTNGSTSRNRYRISHADVTKHQIKTQVRPQKHEARQNDTNRKQSRLHRRDPGMERRRGLNWLRQASLS